MTEGSKRSKTEKRTAQSQIRLISGVMIALFLVLCGYITAYALTNQRTLFENDYNTRPQMLLSQNIRGSILAADGNVLAETLVGEDGTLYRSYPYNEMFSHIVGFATYGKSGLEDAEDYYLVRSGLSLSEKAKYDETGAKYPGNNVRTTLETSLQEAAYRTMGIYRGAVVLSEVKTGRILAMVSKPDFDPNMVRANWDSYLNDSESGVLLNRVTQGTYPPGSTFKIIDAMEYLQEVPDGINTYRYNCTGHFTLENESIHCYHNESHGGVDLTTSFAKSCNTSFANIGASLDKKSFTQFLSKLYFGRALPYDLPAAKSHVKAGEDMNATDLVQLSIGQGETGISPLHLNMITSAVANGGVMMKPYVVERIEAADGRTIRKNEPVQLGRIIDETTAEQMQRLLKSVVDFGTATKLQNSLYTAAGKTGSAEFTDDPSKSHAWFTGYAPAEDPQVCVTIIIEGAGSGGSYAVPMAKDVLDAYFSYGRSAGN